MRESAVEQTMSEMLEGLKKSVQARDAAATHIAEYTNAIKALAQVCEDEETRNYYLVTADELSGKPGFLDAVRSVLRLPGPQKSGLTPGEVKAWISVGNKLDLAAYSNALASIQATLGRMVESGEVDRFEGAKGETMYRLATKRSTSGGEPPKLVPPKVDL